MTILINTILGGMAFCLLLAGAALVLYSATLPEDEKETDMKNES